jgi:hypothetical protein
MNVRLLTITMDNNDTRIIINVNFSLVLQALKKPINFYKYSIIMEKSINVFL